MDWLAIKHIYCIGIKGVGMTMLAQFLQSRGYQITGSDVAESFMTDQILADHNIIVRTGFQFNEQLNSADLVIYSTAYNQDNPEVAWALDNRPTLTYAEALGDVFNQYYGIAVAGSHGKTTVSAWLGFTLWQGGLKPNVLVGSRVPQFNGASLLGSSSLMVIEADEYQNKLRYFQPKMVVLNNIDYDHADFYPTPADYQQAFIDFLAKIPTDGYLIANYDDPLIRRLAPVHCRGRIISYALDNAADYLAYDLKAVNGRQYFKVKMGIDLDDIAEEDEKLSKLAVSNAGNLGDFSTSLPGRHNISNALAVLAASVELGLQLYKIREGIAEFIGTARRLEVLGQFQGATIIDDYAHHPTEIKASLAALRQQYPDFKLRVFFHPHTFSRTLALLDGFVNSFNEADEVGILKIYGSAREEAGGISGQELAQRITVNRAKAGLKDEVSYFEDMARLDAYLRQSAKSGEVIVLMGAGDIFRIGQQLLVK
ncbi:MAG TPA: UDP-N-acetylmuramate--L-alanine ligase [bacterium]|jgi:UDP-N-acetylmuramate--alanine ligase|nr:UDP-N-acetylmuramate--L-alanine ligase [bacterium]HNZ51389.1 UDP-N-acetylmuramate--L-alanine ligase [bacterium]HOF79323.1 UDP-N-acetylmuramate--L-alanine ligase [bacterium]HOH85447.1 UDP-N-acetylmuramate--L-alanine ligase [bacterium]HOQ91752.1 UDP-N-acetylmuramate--L-alanine ligase [bacterium]